MVKERITQGAQAATTSRRVRRSSESWKPGGLGVRGSGFAEEDGIRDSGFGGGRGKPWRGTRGSGLAENRPAGVFLRESRTPKPEPRPLVSWDFRQCRERVSAAMETSAAMTSATYGPQKFETRNCASAKLAPATTADGQAARSPLRPATTSTR